MFNASMAIGSQDLYDTYQRDNDCIFTVQALLYINTCIITDNFVKPVMVYSVISKNRQ
jgi:hypothetical protein